MMTVYTLLTLLEIVGAWASPSGQHWAVAFADGAGQKLVIDGTEVGSADSFEQVELSEEGDYAFYCANADGAWVVANGEQIGPFPEVSMPDLEALSRMNNPTPRERLFRGGTRSVFAARDRDGYWVSLVRYPAAPGAQEKSALPVHRRVGSGADPSMSEMVRIRFVLLKGFVPAFITADEEQECLHLGERVATCAPQVSLLAYSQASGRLVYARHDGQLLTLATGAKEWGPTKLLDWITFSQDGRRLAFVMERNGSQALVVDDSVVAESERIEAVAWTGDDKLIYLEHRKDRSLLHVGADVVLEKRYVSNVYVSSSNAVVARGGEDDETAVLWPLEGWGDLDQIWNEGFLASGLFIGQARMEGGRQSVVLGSASPALVDGVPVFSPSSGAEALAYVTASAGKETLHFGSATAEIGDGHVDGISWCGSESSAVPLVRIRRGASECGRLGVAGEELCCERIVALGCGPDGLEALCLGKGAYSYRTERSPAPDPEAFQDVPTTLLYSDAERGVISFAARRGDGWLVVGGGEERAVDGRPLFVHPGEDGAWFLAPQGNARRWIAPGFSSRACERVLTPFFHEGHSLFVQRCSGKEGWVIDGRESDDHDAIVSRPVFFDSGFMYWAHETGRTVLVRRQFLRTE